ncbi:MAG: hypothetical protein Q4G63_03305 [Bacteroidia bacterium]|nr:hypothetical protein [Bacteroidia bacterium]
MIKKNILILGLMAFCLAAFAQKEAYTVISNKRLKNNKEWSEVISALQKKHKANILYYDSIPREVLPQLRRIKPRYVAIVEKPENIGREFVFDINRFARQVDDDPYTDFLWGIITGYTPESALQMVKNSEKPLIVKSCVSTIQEINNGKWFDTFAYVDDHKKGVVGEKKKGETSVTKEKVTQLMEVPENSRREFSGWDKEPNTLRKFYEFYRDYDPDLIVTASHATEMNLEMPYSIGNIKSEDGILYADFPTGKENLIESGKRRVYLPIGNCLIGNIMNTPESMAVAWLNSANVTAMIGYVVTTWHGRNGWGALKYWLTNSGRYTLSEATFLNQQDMLYQLNKVSPKLQNINYLFDKSYVKNLELMQSVMEKTPTRDQRGFLHDRDVLVYYGDPAWNVRLKELKEETDFTVKQRIKGNKCILAITTKPNFSLKRMQGDDFKKEHVLDLPFSYFFPKRLKNPRLAENQHWECAIDENFILIYNADFKPNSTYEIVLNINR